MSSNMSSLAKHSYSYERLAFDDSIRLIKLLQGTSTDPLECHIFTTRLAEKPKYEAVSYEWKLATMGSSTINIASQSLGLPLNLRQALMSFRLPDRCRVLWADSLCINQNDCIERSQQVMLMREIFAQADKVLVWLGDESFRTEDVFGLFRKLVYLLLLCEERGLGYQSIDSREQLDIIYQPKQLQGLSSLKPIELHNLLELASTTGSAAFHLQDIALWKEADGLFQDSYFERVWIIQEVAVAKSVLVHCGKWYQTWEMVEAAHRGRVLLFNLQDNYTSRIKSFAELKQPLTTVDIARRHHQNPSKGLTLAKVLSTFDFSRCSNPRDMIYAARGLVQKGCGSSIIPYYDKPTQAIFMEAATLMVRESGSIYHLAFRASRNRKILRDLPTWVPDWSSPVSVSAMLTGWSQSLSDCIDGHPQIRGPILSMDGHVLDIVDFVASVNSMGNLLLVIVRLSKKFSEKEGGLFDPYVSYKDHDALLLMNQSDADPNSLARMHNLAEYFFRTYELPLETLQIMQTWGKRQKHQYNHATLNIEALYLVLVSQSQKILTTLAAQKMPAGLPVFLATLFLLAERKSVSRPQEVIADYPKGYGNWIGLAAHILANQGSASYQTLEDVWSDHCGNLDREEAFFVTNNGYFGRAPPGHVEKGHVIAILGGGGTPFVLEKHGGYYEIVSHCYVEGLMDMQSLKPGMSIERLDIH